MAHAIFDGAAMRPPRPLHALSRHDGAAHGAAPAPVFENSHSRLPGIAPTATEL
jgi:hypothetical protein